MAAEHAAIGVQFVQHHVTQVFEQPLPARVVRQDSGVQHVGIRQHNVSALANRLARVGRRIAVVRKYAEAVIESRGQVVQLGELILRERLGGEEVQRARVRIFQHRVQDRQVVAQRFSGRRRRDDHHVASLPDACRSHGLVRIQLRDTFFRVGVSKLRAHPSRHGRKLRFPRRDLMHGGNDFAEAVALGELRDDFPDARERRRVFRGPHRKRLSHRWPPSCFFTLRLSFATLPCRCVRRNGLSYEGFVRNSRESFSRIP